MKNGKIDSFMDLIVWQQGHSLVLNVYAITKQFPKEETYSLVDQMKRAVSSVTANIAEGFGRQTYKEKVQFYYIAKGSLTELNNFLLISKDLNFIDENSFEELSAKSVDVEKLLQGLIKKSKTFINQKSVINNL